VATRASPFARAVISLDPVAVRIDNEGGIVIRAVYRPQAGCTVVLSAGAQRGRVKRIDGDGIRPQNRNANPTFRRPEPDARRKPPKMR
jgi:hypothetical protein